MMNVPAVKEVTFRREGMQRDNAQCAECEEKQRPGEPWMEDQSYGTIIKGYLGCLSGSSSFRSSGEMS